MRAKWLARAGVILGVLGTGWLVYDSYDTLSIADKACLRAAQGAPADQAKAHLRQVAKARGADVIESGDRTTAVFGGVISSGRACTFRVAGEIVIESRVGSPGVLGLHN